MASLSLACAQCVHGLFSGFSGLILCMTLADTAGESQEVGRTVGCLGDLCPGWVHTQGSNNYKGPRPEQDTHAEMVREANGLAETKGTKDWTQTSGYLLNEDTEPRTDTKPQLERHRCLHSPTKNKGKQGDDGHTQSQRPTRPQIVFTPDG